MKIFFSVAFTLLAATAFAQDVKKDSAYRYTLNQPVDTAMANEYGMRFYNPRIARYLPADSAAVQKPYYVADKKKKKKKSR